MQKGYFITIEGIEGVGKSTHTLFLYEYLKNLGMSVTMTREPGGTEIAEAIRQILLVHHKEVMSEHTELLLMFASRAQHIFTVIEPALKKGDWVICDRFTDASFAYQGGGRGIAYPKIKVLEEWVQEDLKPQLTFLLTAPVEVAMKRAQLRKNKLDRFEVEHQEFFERVQNAYLLRAKEDPKRFQIIDSVQSIEAIQVQIKNKITQFIAQNNIYVT